ncbi:hypothetical protein GUJ93_ZPchr0009g1300 [Zizania palustris]|uniref:AIR carboxylase n=1 Tax=Zizania palustris TaxID=103762 RepID=A0A8J5RYN7_ZIZPA|nr:hypothetical protein GUJ93_ZPchr0009g1300 [Zizania palustris]
MIIGVGAASTVADFAAASPYRILPVGPNSIEQSELGVVAAMASATSGLIVSIRDLKELVADEVELQERGRWVVAEEKFSGRRKPFFGSKGLREG